MAYLYQEIMNVPGLSGSWQQRNAQLYKNLGAPMGTYKGNLEQNLWLLNQIKKNNYFKDSQPWNQPAPTPQPVAPVAPQQTISDQYSQPVVEQLNQAAENPQFENAVGFFEDLWRERFEPGITTAAESQIKPEFMRDYNQNYYDYMNQMASAGGGRLGRGRAGLGNMKAASNRAYLGTVNDWVDQQKGNLLNNWYTPTQNAWNEARLNASFNENEYNKIPTWQEGLEKYGSAYGAGVSPGLF